MPDSDDRRCGSCKWWEFIHGENVGLCRRCCPEICDKAAGDFGGIWPETDGVIDWCAQHEFKETTDNAN